MGDEGNSGLTVEELTDMLSSGVAGRVGGQIADVSAQVDGVAERLDGLAGRVAALESGVEGVAEVAANTRNDLQAASASLSASLEEATLQGDEIGPVLDDSLGSLITVVGQVLEILDSDSDGASDVGSVVSEIRTELQDVAAVVVHPALSTPFESYSVLEALLLLLILWKFLQACVGMLGSGFSWLR